MYIIRHIIIQHKITTFFNNSGAGWGHVVYSPNPVHYKHRGIEYEEC